MITITTNRNNCRILESKSVMIIQIIVKKEEIIQTNIII